jgi:hypothetical protein
MSGAYPHFQSSYSPSGAPAGGGVRGVFRAVIEVLVPAMFHPREHLPLRGSTAFQPIRHDDSQDVPTPFEQLPKEFLGGCFVAAALHENIEHVSRLIHRPPQIMPSAMDHGEDFVQMPRVAWPGAPTPQLMGIHLATLAAPRADGSVRQRDTACKQQLFDIAIAEAKMEIEPRRVADDLDREAVVLIAVAGWCGHAPSMAHQASARQAAQ